MSDNVEIVTPLGVVRSTSGALAEAMAELIALGGRGTELDLDEVLGMTLDTFDLGPSDSCTAA